MNIIFLKQYRNLMRFHELLNAKEFLSVCKVVNHYKKISNIKLIIYLYYNPAYAKVEVIESRKYGDLK